MSYPTNQGATVNTQGFANASLGALGLIPFISDVAPTSSNITGPSGPWRVGQVWINSVANEAYVLTSISAFNGLVTANWEADAGSSTLVGSLSDQSGIFTYPSAGNIQLNGTSNQIETVAGTNEITFSLVGPYTPATYTAHGVLVGEGTSSIVATTPGTNGQVLIGSTGADPAFSTLTTSTGITFTGGAHSLAINTTGGGLKANAESGAGPFSGATQNSYILSEAAQTTVSLPATSAVGDFFIVCGTNANSGGFVVSQETGQEIFSTTNHSTSGATGSISTAAANTSVFLMCTAANTSWIVLAATGTVTYT